MQCPKCGSNDRRKAGFIGENQRWLCKGCGCKYTRSTPRGIPTEVKRRALQLYLEGMGFRAIGRVLGVSNVAVLKWIRTFGEEAERFRKPSPPPKIAMIDEVWHFVHAKKHLLAVDIDVLFHRTPLRRLSGRTRSQRLEGVSEILS